MASDGARSIGSPLSVPSLRSDRQDQMPGWGATTDVVLRRRPDRRDRSARERLVERLESEFMGMPGLRLNASQTARLFGITPETCERILATLADRGVLTSTPDGGYTLGFQRA